MSFFQIPGNVKQIFAPFVLNPDNKMNQPVKSSTDLTGATPQVFSYKSLSASAGIVGDSAKLNFYPSSMNSLAINDDISFKLLYYRNPKTYSSNKSVTIQDLLNAIPGVQIREFLPDTRLDQCINLFTDFISNMTKLFTDDKKEKSSSSNNDPKANTDAKDDVGLFKKITAASWYTMKYLVGATDPSFFDDLSFGSLTDLPFSSYNKEVYQNNNKYPGSFVMAFPYTLYYRLQSCVTTNIYEIPASTSNKTILASGGGMSGWTDGGDMLSQGGFRISEFLGKIPVIGSLANMVLGNIGVNYMPWWNAESGSKTKEPQIEIKFDLFNDNDEAALANFIFVNTLVPNNKWIQYNMFQHSSSLYDVKIEGLNRLFACAGDFNVTYEGVLRDPPRWWILKLAWLHGNKCMSNEFMNNIIENKLIKIPDVYRVQMNFQSILPANFNNYIFAYAENASHITKYKDGPVYQQSAVAPLLAKAIKQYTDKVKIVWDKGEETVEVNKKINQQIEDAKKEAAEAEARANKAIGKT